MPPANTFPSSNEAFSIGSKAPVAHVAKSGASTQPKWRSNVPSFHRKCASGGVPLRIIGVTSILGRLIVRSNLVLAATIAALMLGITGVSVMGEGKAAEDKNLAPEGAKKDAPKSYLKDAKKGDPAIGYAGCLTFGPNGLMLIGGAKYLFAIETGDTTPSKTTFTKIEDVKGKIAKSLGAKPDEIRVACMALNPASGKLYCGVVTSTKSHLEVINPDGSIEEFKFKDLNYVQVKLPLSDNEGGAQFSSIVWTEKRVICSVLATGAFTGHVMSVPVPLANGTDGQIVDCNSYHTTHQGWETRSPLSAITVYERDKKSYLIAGVSCTPVIQYPVDDIKQGAELKGTTPFDLQSQDVLDLFTYTKDGKKFLFLVYAAADEGSACLRINDDFLTEKTAINEKASTIIQVNDGGADSVPDKFAARVQKLDGFENVVRAMPMGDKKVLVARKVKEVLSLEVLDLP